MRFKINKIFLIIIFVIGLLSLGTFFVLSHVIYLNGAQNITIALNEEYEEKGAVNTFKSSKDIDISGKVDNTKVGTYKIQYKTSILGIDIKKYRYVEVVDEEAPLIELVGKKEIVLCPNGEYKEEGYKATDKYDGDLTKDVKVEDRSDVITYSVSDSSGNSYKVNRSLKRVDNETPSIKLKGSSTYNILIGKAFNDPGYTVSDNCDSEVKVTVSGKVNTNKAGTYEIVYTAVDASNNTVNIKRYVKVMEKVTNNTGVIYLTFDDGPSASSTPKILDILDKKGVKATFFVINHGEDLDYLIKRAYDSGHTIALHSYTHKYDKIYSSKENFYSDLNLISNKVEKITGEKSMIMRFPGGGSNTISKKYSKGIMTELTKEVVDLGYHYFDWNVSSGDAGGAKNSEAVYNNVIKGLKKNSRNVVLLHDFANNNKTVNALEDIIDYGFANGYRFDKIDMTTPMIRHGVNN